MTGFSESQQSLVNKQRSCGALSERLSDTSRQLPRNPAPMHDDTKLHSFLVTVTTFKIVTAISIIIKN